MSRRAVFLDRDGVINAAVVRNGKPYPPDSLAELTVLPGVPEALARLRAAGFLLIVATNQPDVARGTQRQEAIEAMHTHLQATLPLDEIRACYHDDHDGCDCRKPLPGMLLAGAAHWDVDLKASYMVGDRWKDIEAGQRAGCTTLLVAASYSEQARCQPDHCVADLAEAADWILDRSTQD